MRGGRAGVLLLYVACAARGVLPVSVEDDEQYGNPDLTSLEDEDLRPEELPPRLPGQPSDVVNVTEERWDAEVLDKGRDVMVLLYSDWDYHSGAVMPHYEAVATALRREAVTLMRCDTGERDRNPSVQTRYGFEGWLKGWPHFLWFPRGAKGGEEVLRSSGRTASRIVAWFNKRLGTHRAVDGTLLPSAARHDELDRIVAASLGDFAGARRQVEESDVCAGPGGAAPACERYAKALGRAAERGAAWATAERRRLRGMLSGRRVSDDKRDGVALRAGVLDAVCDAWPMHSREELARHTTAEDLWVAVRGVVHRFPAEWVRTKHPGGDQILEAAGRDGTGVFDGTEGTNKESDFSHSEESRVALRAFAVGWLDETAPAE